MGSKEKRLPVRIQKIVGACKAGETLCLHIKHSEVGDERVFWLEPSGRPAGTKSAQEAIELGHFWCPWETHCSLRLTARHTGQFDAFLS